MIEDLQTQVRAAANARYGHQAGASLTGGLNNVRGEWLEYILGVVFWNTVAASRFKDTVVVRLPNAAQLPFHEVYEPQAKAYLNELFDSLREHDIHLIMSNPDFICVTGLPDSLAEKLRTPLAMGEACVNTLETAYQEIRGRCHAMSITE